MDREPEKEQEEKPVDWGFDDDHTVGESYGGRGSVKRSHRAEGRNFVD